MTFPTEQDRLFFTSEEAKRIQELWEQITIGDWYADEHGTVQVVEYERMICLAIGGSEVSIWLPRPDQLWEMLEERGCKRICLRRSFFDQKAFGGDPEWAVDLRDGPYPQTVFGPTPAIALGRALIEVLKEE